MIRKSVLAYAVILSGCMGQLPGDSLSKWDNQSGPYDKTMGGGEFVMLLPVYAVFYGGVLAVSGTVAGIRHLAEAGDRPPVQAPAAVRSAPPTQPRLKVCRIRGGGDQPAASCPAGCDYVVEESRKNFREVRKCPGPTVRRMPDRDRFGA